MILGLAMLLILAATALAAGAAARFLRRRIPPPALALFLLVAVAPFPRAYVADVSILPLDHARNVVPWMGTYHPAFNPFLNDVATQIVPWAKEVRLAWKEGALPLRTSAPIFRVLKEEPYEAD